MSTNDLREAPIGGQASEARPGFDIKRFHGAMIDGGNLPLTVLERQVRAAMG